MISLCPCRLKAKRWLVVVISTIAFPAPVALAVFCAPAIRAQSQLTFDVASIRPNRSGDRAGGITPPVGGRFRATNINLALLIRTAYEVEDFQIAGGPKWLKSDTYDVEAEAEGHPDLKQIRLMLQNLLKDRFRLVTHYEKKELPVYVLTLAKSGSKLSPPTDPNCLPSPAGTCGGFRVSGGGTVSAQNVAMPQLARFLSTILLRPVLDRTGLSGVFNLKLSYSPEAGIGEPPRDPNTPRTDPNAESIFVALQEQAGLKLESEKSEVEIIVIDGADKPSEN